MLSEESPRMAKRKEAQPALPPDAPAPECHIGSVNLPGFQMVDVTIALGELPKSGYFTPNFDVQLTSDQARTLARVISGLKAVSAKAKNGRGPRDGSEAVAYLLELVEMSEAESHTEGSE
jgi:hypothetical protein